MLVSEEKWAELESQYLEGIKRVFTPADLFNNKAELYINLEEDADTLNYDKLGAAVLINSVATPLHSITQNKKTVRMNGWTGFLKNQVWEISGPALPEVESFAKHLKKDLIYTMDVPGFISARVISMIINEAYLSLQDGISSREDIDIAMKLGTGYPHGPFAWANLIGEKEILKLLNKLSETDSRFLPASNLVSNK